MLGLPTETLEDVYEVADLIKQTTMNNVLCNYYVLTPGQPLARLPQMSDSLREYHLKILLKELRSNPITPLRVKHHTIFKKPYSRKTVRMMKELQETDNYRLFPGYWGDAFIIKD